MTGSTASYPDAAVHAALVSFWDEQMGASDGAVGMFSVGPALDSLTAVTVLVDLEGVVEIKDLPETLVKKGGYHSKEEFVEHLATGVREYCLKS